MFIKLFKFFCYNKTFLKYSKPLQDMIRRRLNANSRLKSRDMLSSRLIKQQVGSEEMELELVEINKEIASLERQRNVSSAYKNVWYPLLMLIVLALTCVSLLFVSSVGFQCLLGNKKLVNIVRCSLDYIDNVKILKYKLKIFEVRSKFSK